MNQPYRANDAEAVSRRKDREKDRLTQQQDDLRALLKLPEFRRYIWGLIGRCKLMESPGSTNGSVQSHNVGRQDVGRELWAEIESVDPLTIPQMMVEHHEAQQ